MTMKKHIMMTHTRDARKDMMRKNGKRSPKSGGGPGMSARLLYGGNRAHVKPKGREKDGQLAQIRSPLVSIHESAMST